MHTLAVDGHSHGETYRYKKTHQEMWTIPNLKLGGSEEDVAVRLVAYKTTTAKPNASSESDCRGSPKAEKTEVSHSLHMYRATVRHMEAVFSIVRGIYGREHDLDTNAKAYVFSDSVPCVGKMGI